jgi:Zn finger protein HypA/HybF involved in hydrogenase expression
VSDEQTPAVPKEPAPITCSLEADAEPWRWCPRCGHELENHKCKLRCPRCHYFMSCSDFD